MPYPADRKEEKYENRHLESDFHDSEWPDIRQRTDDGLPEENKRRYGTFISCIENEPQKSFRFRRPMAFAAICLSACAAVTLMNMAFEAGQSNHLGEKIDEVNLPVNTYLNPNSTVPGNHPTSSPLPPCSTLFCPPPPKRKPSEAPASMVPTVTPPTPYPTLAPSLPTASPTMRPTVSPTAYPTTLPPTGPTRKPTRLPPCSTLFCPPPPKKKVVAGEGTGDVTGDGTAGDGTPTMTQ
uniref:Uncharacterized protein n=1 Tax=Lotharella globosa TaxID=91324 RepID=A0A7S3Z944_9EUKA